MIFENKTIVEAPADRIWNMLLDPNVMGACVPGVEAIEVVSDVEYLVTVQVKLAFISARFNVRTKIIEARPPVYLRSTGTGEDSSLTSSLTQTSEVFLTDQGNGTSELRTRLVVELMGRFGTFGLNIIKTKVNRMWAEFSDNLSRKLAAPDADSAEGKMRLPASGTIADVAAKSIEGYPGAGDAATSGPLVWLDMDQTALDKAYNQADYAANRQQLLDRYVTRSKISRSVRGDPVRRAYGESEIEQLDIYICNKAKAPINIFIHGGAWRLGSASECGFFAELFNNAGSHLVIPDFTTVGQADGSLFPMVEQVRKAIAWVYANAGAFGGDRNRIFLSGTSSGAHLAAVALTSDWSGYDVPKDLFKGALLCSGIYDLEPVRRSARSSYVRFTDEMVDELSPIRHLERLNTPLVVVYGSLETPEFKRQSRDFAEAVRQKGWLTELQLADGYNHFEIHETLGDPYDVLGRAVLKQMALS